MHGVHQFVEVRIQFVAYDDDKAAQGGQGGGQGEGGQGEGGQGDKDALDQIEVSQGMSKVLVDGVLYIVRQGAIYTATGVRVK